MVHLVPAGHIKEDVTLLADSGAAGVFRHMLYCLIKNKEINNKNQKIFKKLHISSSI